MYFIFDLLVYFDLFPLKSPPLASLAIMAVCNKDKVIEFQIFTT